MDKTEEDDGSHHGKSHHTKQELDNSLFLEVKESQENNDTDKQEQAQPPSGITWLAKSSLVHSSKAPKCRGKLTAHAGPATVQYAMQAQNVILASNRR